MARLNVVSGDEDSQMDAIRHTIDVFDTVFGLRDLIAVLDCHCQREDRVEVLDMIGHSGSHGFLVFGNWVIDDSPQTAASFSELLKPCLQQLGVRTIRLLGCSTAGSERGRATIHRIARATGCDVAGTKRHIGKNDYGPSGFSSSEALVDASGLSFVGFATSGHSRRCVVGAASLDDTT